jgi:hypothetical protein
MSRVLRIKTEPEPQSRRHSLPISWSLAPKVTASDFPESPVRNSSFSIQLPKLRRVSLTETEKDVVNAKILRMKKLSYDPIGCSRSLKLEKVLLRKKINRPKAVFNDFFPESSPVTALLK